MIGVARRMATVAFVAPLLISTRAAAMDFADDFESGTLSAWQCNPCEDWSVTCANSEGTALVIQPFAPSLLSTLCVNGLEWTDFQLDVDLRGLIPTDKMVRLRNAGDTGEYYYVNLRSAPINDLWLARYVPFDGSSAVLATVPLPHEVGEWHHLAIRAEGARIRVWADDTLRIDATDESPILHGGICLGGWTGAASQCAVQWDNVAISDLASPISIGPATWGKAKGNYRE